MSKGMFDDSTFEGALDELLRLARASRAADIDANACGTRSDYAHARTLDEKFRGAKDAFLARFAGDVNALEAERAKVCGLMAALNDAHAKLRDKD